MISTSAYLRIVRASAWYDLVVTAGFMTPWTVALVLSGLNALAQALGVAGAFPPFAVEHVLVANLLGSLVTVWAVLRLRERRVVYGRYDAGARLLFAVWQLHALLHGGNPLIWGFFMVEVGFGMVQALPVRK